MIELIGKNGAGKTYIANKLLEYGFQRSIGYTTRSKRDGERDGVDYFFVSKSAFEEMIQNNDFIDYKIKCNDYYGIRRKDLKEDSILVSGDSKKIEKQTGFKVYKIYINCDIAKRYARVLLRKESTLKVFNRFHMENFSYLYNFNAIFIENCDDNDNSIYEVLDFIEDKNRFLSNREFIQKELQKYNFDLESDKLLLMLMYEEYLMRKNFIDQKSLVNENIVKEYYYYLKKYASSLDVDYSISEKGLLVYINDEKYNFNYLGKRLVKK